MEHLMAEGAVQPARYETYVENLHQVTQAIRKNYVVNLQMDLRFLALQLLPPWTGRTYRNPARADAGTADHDPA
mgnify:CR=1 FL=1